MYYHVELRKIFHDGCRDDAAIVEWDFRSLNKALSMVKRDFGGVAECWRIEYLTERTVDLMSLERSLQRALENTYQTVILTFKDGVSEIEKYDHYDFFFVIRDEAERPPKYSFSEDDESAIEAPAVIFTPDFRKSIVDVVRSFDILEKFDVVAKAFESIVEFYCDKEEVPKDVMALRDKDKLSAEDCILLGDECQSCDEEQLAVRLFVAGYFADGANEKKGEALIRVADLYMSSDWPRNGGREWDVMKAVDLLTEALALGCVQDARNSLEGMREQIFEEWDEEVDVDHFIRNYEADALCLAAFCLAVGIGWKKDVQASKKLYEAALSRGYERASYYLDEIKRGRL